MAEKTEATDLMIIGDITGTMDRPKSLTTDATGTEGIGADDVRLPRLSIAQGLSPQMLPDDSNYIKGLALGDMFNDLTGEVYGRGPVTFIPVRRDWRGIEFIPRNEGGGIRDANVPKGDARLKWKGDVAPVATEFIEFISLLLRKGKAPEKIILSIKTTNKWNRKAAKNLSTFIALRNAPIYSGLYTVSSGTEKNDKGTFGVFSTKNAGFIPLDTPGGQQLYAYAEKQYEAFKDAVIAPPREPGADDFDPSELEPEPAKTEM